jgi:proliferating cell nuclear antigen
MSEVVAEGIIEASRLIDWAQTFASKVPGVKTPFVTECKVHFDEDGMHVGVYDPAQVAMVGPTLLSKRAFESYNAPGRVTQGINLERLIELVKPAEGSQFVGFGMDMETRRLDIEYGQADLDMGLIDPANIRKEPDIPELDLPNTAIITGSQLDDALTVADLVADHVAIRVDVDAGSIAFTTQGDIDKGAVEYPRRECEFTDFTETTESLFSLDYLRMLSKPIPADAEVRIRTGDEYPVRFSWESMDGHFDVKQTLAPRIQSD